MSSPAIEFKTEGLITGIGAKMFAIAGPVIVYGTFAATIYGLKIENVKWKIKGRFAPICIFHFQLKKADPQVSPFLLLRCFAVIHNRNLSQGVFEIAHDFFNLPHYCSAV